MEVKQLASEQGVPDNRIAVFQFFIDVRVGSCSRILKTAFVTERNLTLLRLRCIELPKDHNK